MSIKEQIIPRDIASQLWLLQQNLAEHTYPGYPERAQRLVLPIGELALHGGSLPEGPWDTTPGQYPTAEEQVQLRERGISLDGRGRPLHPWLMYMLANDCVGAVTGKGFYRHWGPNYTADAVVLHEDQILLVTREDTGLLALPGGFVDPGESTGSAARREVREETGIVLEPDEYSGQVYRGPVVDLRVTANAWPVTTAYRYDLKQKRTPKGMDDAAHADWYDLQQLYDDHILFGSHRFLLNRALQAAALNR